MQGNFETPSVDHLIKGVHYRIVGWDFASQAPSSSRVQQPPPGEPCPEGTKMIYGLCRKVKGSNKDWDSDSQSDPEKAATDKAKAAGSSFENNKQVDIGGKKYGWAKKNGKDVLVEWGSVAGTAPKKPKNPAAPAATPAAPAATPAAPRA